MDLDASQKLTMYGEFSPFIGRLEGGEREIALMGPMVPNEPRRTTKGPKWKIKRGN